MRCSGRMVTGSTIMPASLRFTLSTSAACSVDRQVLVDDAEAALLGERDRQARLGDRVHPCEGAPGRVSAVSASPA